MRNVFVLLLLATTLISCYSDYVWNSAWRSTVLYKLLREEEKNFIFSPFGLYATLSLLYQGATGSSADTFIKFLKMHSKKSVAEEYRAILKDMQVAMNISMVIDNQLFTDTRYELKNTFRDIIKKYFLAEVKALSADSGEIQQIIDSWGKRKMDNVFKTRMPKRGHGLEYPLVVLNTIKFEGKLNEHFDPKNTAKAKFYVNKTHSVDCEMMHTVAEFLYADCENIESRIVRLNFKDKRLRLTIILPYTKSNMEELEKYLASKRFHETLNYEPIERHKLELRLPKFSIRSVFQVNRPFEQMGLDVLLEGSSTMFSSIFTNLSNLTITQLFQKAMIKVSESDVKASSVQSDSAQKPRERRDTRKHTIKFFVNRPFAFLVTIFVNSAEEHLLYMGKVLSPLDE